MTLGDVRLGWRLAPKGSSKEWPWGTRKAVGGAGVRWQRVGWQVGPGHLTFAELVVPAPAAPRSSSKDVQFLFHQGQLVVRVVIGGAHGACAAWRCLVGVV